MPTPLDLVHSYWNRIKPSSPVYSFFFSDIKIIDAQEGAIRAQLLVGPNHINSKGSLHGSVSATIVDWAGGLAIATYGLEKTGLSTDIHITYVSTAKEGDILGIEGKVSKLGRTLAFTTINISKPGKDGKESIVATGTHTKYVSRDTEAPNSS